MQHDRDIQIPGHAPAPSLPRPLDSETRALLCGFLTPILEQAQSWAELESRLLDKGFSIGFCTGRLVISNATSGEPLCTGQSLGVPLRELSARMGRPVVKVAKDGQTGRLRS